MTRHNTTKWTTLCTLAGLIAASGQACPPEAPLPTPANSLEGVWTGPIRGEGAVNSRTNNPSPPNPTDSTTDATYQSVATVQIVVKDGLRQIDLPRVPSAFYGGFVKQSLTVFNPGETQTIANETKYVSPSGATYSYTDVLSDTTTLTVTESVITMDHFRVVYETSNNNRNIRTYTAPMSTPSSSSQTSTGTLTLEGTLVNGQLMFSANSNQNGSRENKSGATTQIGNGFAVATLTGTLFAK
jgi:hypothetical protein